MICVLGFVSIAIQIGYGSAAKHAFAVSVAGNFTLWMIGELLFLGFVLYLEEKRGRFPSESYRSRWP